VIRLFAAVEVPPEIGEDLQAAQRGLEGARWRPLEALHVTLRFFGEVQESVAGDIDTELGAITCPPFDLSVEGAGSFGEGHKARAIWAGVSDSEPLRQLAARCEAAARRAGLAPENRRYKPHVTLAYLKRVDAQKTAEWVSRHSLMRSAPFRVTWFGLWSSWLSPQGSRYELEREYPLV
jgi:2'-5' RNA ligase